MLDFIIKYWVQELFGLIVIVGGLVGKKLWKRYSAGKQLEKEQLMESHDQKILDKINEMCNAVTMRIDRLEQKMETLEQRNATQDANSEILKQGILSLQREIFLAAGKELLEAGHIISYEEYMSYTQQHTTYNKLGGNHEGDEQFKLVTQKYKSGLKNFEDK